MNGVVCVFDPAARILKALIAEKEEMRPRPLDGSNVPVAQASFTHHQALKRCPACLVTTLQGVGMAEWVYDVISLAFLALIGVEA